jgi:hypothetical protein
MAVTFVLCETCQVVGIECNRCGARQNNVFVGVREAFLEKNCLTPPVGLLSNRIGSNLWKFDSM